jgi:hypothetical protein
VSVQRSSSNVAPAQKRRKTCTAASAYLSNRFGPPAQQRPGSSTPASGHMGCSHITYARASFKLRSGIGLYAEQSGATVTVVGPPEMQRQGTCTSALWRPRSSVLHHCICVRLPRSSVRSSAELRSGTCVTVSGQLWCSVRALAAVLGWWRACLQACIRTGLYSAGVPSFGRVRVQAGLRADVSA